MILFPLQKIWGAPAVIPHDDAYTILTKWHSAWFVSILKGYIEDAAFEQSTSILEPLLALIVDHSSDPDRIWPTVLSRLMESGIMDYFCAIATLPLPQDRHPSFRDVQRAKRDGVTGILRCFEQITETDARMVSVVHLETLQTLIEEVGQPMLVQRLAEVALDVWTRCVSIRRNVIL